MIIVTGGGGQLGTAMRAVLPQARFLTRAELDLARRDVAFRIAEYVPSAIFNCAAYTDVDGAEREEDEAFRINADAVGELAEYAARFDIPFVTFSSDYVFAGDAQVPYTESFPPGPLNAYGRSKLAGEKQALEAYPRALVIRTSWLVSGTHDNFVTAILRRARSGERLQVVADQFGRPTIAADLAQATMAAVSTGIGGLLHLSNSGMTTWFDFAQRVVQLAGFSASVVRPCTSDDYSTVADRPAYSVLESERLASIGIAPLPPWEDSLPAVVAAQLQRLDAA